MQILRREFKTILVAMVTAAVTAGAPAIAHGVQHALFAHNADKVDGKHAVGATVTPAQAKGKLVATGKKGKFPAKFLQPYPVISAKRRNFDTAGEIIVAAGAAAKILEVEITAPAGGQLFIDQWSSFYTATSPASGLTWVELDQATDCETTGNQFPPNKIPGSRTLFEISSTADFYETPAASITVPVGKGTHSVTLCESAVEGSIAATDAGLNAIFMKSGTSSLVDLPGETGPGKGPIGR